MNEIIEQFEKRKNISLSSLARQYENTKLCQAFYSGEWGYKENSYIIGHDGKKRKLETHINYIKPYVNSIRGFLIQNRNTAKYLARIEKQDEMRQYSQYVNAIAQYVRDNANADSIESQADTDMLICGYGAVETSITYSAGQSTKDPGGEIIMGRLDPLRVGWDPKARSQNLLDARWVFYSADYDLNEAVSLFGEEEDSFETAGTSAAAEGSPAGRSRDTGYPSVDITAAVNSAGMEFISETEKTVRVWFYQWYDNVPFWRAENPIKFAKDQIEAEIILSELIRISKIDEQAYQDMFSMSPDDEILTMTKTQYAEFVKKFNVDARKFVRKVYKTAVISGKKLLRSYANISQQGFTIKFKTGDFDEYNKIWVGIVNSMIDPVKYHNKALTELMYIVAANAKGGIIAEEGFASDVRDFERNYAKADSVCVVSPGYISGGKIRDKRTPHTPTGYEAILDITASSIPAVTGIDRSFLGSSESSRETGILQKRRVRQVVTTLASFFDSVSLYAKEHARLLLDYIKIYSIANKNALIRVLGKDGSARFISLSGDRFAEEYDVSITEAPQTPEEKQEISATLVAIADRLASVGDPAAKKLYAIALNNMSIDAEDKQVIISAMLGQQAPDPAYVAKLEETVRALMARKEQVEVGKKAAETVLLQAKTDLARAQAATEIEAASAKSAEAEIMKKATTVPLEPSRIII